jgi:hypothetical protein
MIAMRLCRGFIDRCALGEFAGASDSHMLDVVVSLSTAATLDIRQELMRILPDSRPPHAKERRTDARIGCSILRWYRWSRAHQDGDACLGKTTAITVWR